MNGLLRRLGPTLLFVAFLFLYLVTLTDVHTFDALSYVRDVDTKPWRELFHPHHLAYGPFGALIAAVSTQADLTTSALLPLQMANVVAGALGVALFYRVARTHLRGRALPWALALLLGGSYAYWYYAVEVEVYTIAAVFLIVALGLLIRSIEYVTLRDAAILGFVQGLAVLFHQTNVLLLIPAILALLLGTRREVSRQQSAVRKAGILGRGLAKWRRSHLVVAYAAMLALVVGVSYLWVGLGVSRFRTAAELIDWARGYTATGWWGGEVSSENWVRLGQGLADTFAQPGGGLVLVGLVSLLLVNARSLMNEWRRACVLGSWLLVYGLFFFWWEPDNIEFWIASLPPLLLLVGIGVDGRCNAAYNAPRTAHLNWQTFLLFMVAATVLVLNGAAVVARGDATRDLQRAIARTLAAHAREGDLLLVPDGLQELYLPYYEGRDNVLSLNQALFDSGGEWTAACERIQSAIDTALRSGFAVLVADEVLRPRPALPSAPPGPLERFGLQQTQIDVCFAPVLPLLEELQHDPDLPRYYRIAAAAELREKGWDFRRGYWGWQAANVVDEALVGSGWRFVPKVDASLTSPPLRFELAAYRAVELTLSSETEARDAQLFLLDEQGYAEEARSIRWKLIPGAQMQRYELDLSEVSDQGVVTRLRLDPVGVGDGASVVIQSIRLLKEGQR
jgi:hypothetical protein